MAKVHPLFTHYKYDPTSANDDEIEWIINWNQQQALRLHQHSKYKKDRGIYSITGKFRINWDIFVITLAIYNCFSIPYRVVFKPQTNYSILLDIIDISIDGIFIIDIYLNFKTSYLDSKTGQQITERKKIANRYIFKGRFFLDLIASIPFDIFVLFVQISNELTLVKLVKLTRIMRLSKIIYYMRFRQSVKITIRIAKVVLFILIYLHFIASGWHFLVQIEENWQKTPEIGYYSGQSWLQYTFAFYMGVSTLIGIEISPTNNYQYVYCMSLILAGALIITYVLGEIAVLIYDLNRMTRIFNTSMDQVNTVMKNLRLTEDLQLKIIQYITSNNVYILHNKDWTSFQKIVSRSFINEIKLHEYKNIVFSHQILGKFPKAIQKFILNLQYNFLRPGQDLIRTGDFSESFYFIVRGALKVSVEGFDHLDHYVRTLKTGDYCGQIGLLYNTKRTADVTAIDYCTLGALSASVFHELMKQHRKLGLRFKERLTETYNDPWRDSIKVKFIQRILRKLSYLHSLDQLTLDQIIYSLEKESFEQSTLVFEEKAVPSKVYIILDGKVTISTIIHDSGASQHLQLRQIRVRTDLSLRSQQTLRRSKVRRQTLPEALSQNLVGLPLMSLSTGSILCGILAVLQEKMNIYCTTDRPTTMFVLKAQTIQAIAQENIRLKIGVQNLKNRYSQHTSFGEYVIVPPVLDCNKAFLGLKMDTDIKRQKSMKKMKNVILMVLRQRRVNRINKIYSFRGIKNKLRAITEAQNSGQFELARKLANGQIHFETLKLRTYLKNFEMKDPVIFQFACQVETMKKSTVRIEQLGDQLMEQTQKLKILQEENSSIYSDINDIVDLFLNSI